MTQTAMDFDAARKPEGGFIFITALQICLVWWAYLEKHIELRDVRIWFAAWELKAKRCLLKPGQRARYTLEGLADIAGKVMARTHLRASIRRLEAVGLLRWSSAEISFPRSAGELTVTPSERLWQMLDAIPSVGRRIPVPRRMVRFVAAGSRRCVLATILGHLVRCLFYKGGECHAKGCLKASWIAEVFGVNASNVKAARTYLVRLGWLIPLETCQRVKNRYGQWMVINLTWDPKADTVVIPCGKPIKADPKPQPPTALSTLKSHPPKDINQKPLRENTKNQNPALSRLAGVWIREEKLGEPRLRHIIPEDLRDTGRLLALFEEAQAQGLIGGSEHERLTFVATAERACLVGSTNPCGFFAQLIRRGLWHFVTQDHEDAAHERLKAYFHGVTPRRRPPPVPTLSDDARLVAELQSRLCLQFDREDVFLLLRRESPEWTRERWDRAVAEVEAARRAQAKGFTSAEALLTRCLGVRDEEEEGTW
jgi:hypothetical protein